MYRRGRPHLVVDISGHGFGHVSQVAPVVDALARRLPDLHITLRSAAPAALLQQRLSCAFQLLPAQLDFGMVMTNALEVDSVASAAAYRVQHADWDAKVLHAAAELSALQADLLLADVPYLSLAAAQAAGVPAVAMSSLNWADIYLHYCAEDAVSAVIHAQMLAAYNSAACFIRLQPAMPMPQLHNTCEVGAVVQTMRNRRAEIDIPARLVLVSMGGVAFRPDLQVWPQLDGVCWLVPQAWQAQRQDMVAVESLGMPFSDVLASCDLVLTKPGYGTFVEAGCAGVPVLYVSRNDWPEEACLVAWLKRHGACRELSKEALRSGNFVEDLRALWAATLPPLPSAPGAEQVAELLLPWLQGNSQA